MATEYCNNVSCQKTSFKSPFGTPADGVTASLLHPSLPSPLCNPTIVLPIFSRFFCSWLSFHWSSRIKPLLEMCLEALEHLFFNVFDVGEPVPTSDIAAFTVTLKLHNKFFH